MATFTEIKEVRLRISDPEGFIDFQEASSWPGTPAPQTAYRISGVYYDTETTTVDLLVSDSRISDWYDDYGVTGAVVRALKAIIAGLAARIPIVRSDSGAESTEYTSLVDMYAFYKGLLSDAESDDDKANDVSTGGWYTASTPEIAGGNV